MRGAIMQPTYIPWLGYFAMIDEVDIFIFLDSVQLNKRSWQTRNRIKERDGKELMLTIPLHIKGRDETRICDAVFADDAWRCKHITCISQNYSKCKYYDEIIHVIKPVYDYDTNKLADFNINFIKTICRYLGINTVMLRSSELGNIDGNKDNLLVNICKRVSIDTYLSARGSSVYIESNAPAGAFGKSEIKLEYQNYEHPVYQQKGREFMPYLGIVDVLFNHGRSSLAIIRSGIRRPFDSQNVFDDRI